MANGLTVPRGNVIARKFMSRYNNGKNPATESQDSLEKLVDGDLLLKTLTVPCYDKEDPFGIDPTKGEALPDRYDKKTGQKEPPKYDRTWFYKFVLKPFTNLFYATNTADYAAKTPAKKDTPTEKAAPGGTVKEDK